MRTTEICANLAVGWVLSAEALKDAPANLVIPISETESILGINLLPSEYTVPPFCLDIDKYCFDVKTAETLREAYSNLFPNQLIPLMKKYFYVVY